MKRHLPVISLAALIVAFVVFYFMRAASVIGPAAPTRAAPSLPGSAQSKPEVQKSKGPAVADSERSHLADHLNSPTGTIQADLRIVEEILGTFRSNLPREGNPVGTNAEIVAVLTGKNKLRFAFIPPDHPAINKAGELCDRWGTPFFFHAESGTRMTVESAGPDKKRHTADDVVFAP
jgi:hypothetical protein